MRITYEHRFAAPLDRVVAMMGDEEFSALRARATGAEACDTFVDHLEDGSFTVVMRCTMPANTIPAEFRAFLGSNLTVRYTEVWSAPEHQWRSRRTRRHVCPRDSWDTRPRARRRGLACRWRWDGLRPRGRRSRSCADRGRRGGACRRGGDRAGPPRRDGRSGRLARRQVTQRRRAIAAQRMP